MIELIGLVIIVSSIAAYARGRGGSPWLWGSLALGGYILIELLTFAATRLILGETNPLLPLILSWGWVGAVALYARFGLGHSQPKPGSMWNCTNCKYLNQRYAVVCEACKQPYAESLTNRPPAP